MKFRLKPLSESDRTFALNLVWVGFSSSMLLLAGKLFGFFDDVRFIGGGFASGSLIALIFMGRQDEYFQGLVALASRWALAVVGLWFFASIIAFPRPFATDEVFGLVVVAATFHCVLAIARLWGSFDITRWKDSR